MMKITEVKEKYPAVYNAIFKIGYNEGLQDGKDFSGKVENELNELLDSEKDQTSNVEAKARQAWDGDMELQKEFGGDFECWSAYFKANSEGRVRIVGKVVS